MKARQLRNLQVKEMDEQGKETLFDDAELDIEIIDLRVLVKKREKKR